MILSMATGAEQEFVNNRAGKTRNQYRLKDHAAAQLDSMKDTIVRSYL